MSSIFSDSPEGRRRFSILFTIVILCWLPFVFAHLYFLGFSNMDSWTLTAPAAMAPHPFAITEPFLGSFEGADKAWGLHWPGGPLLGSCILPFLPHHPATYVILSMGYWLLESVAMALLVWRLTGSRWMKLCGFLLVASDHLCFNVAWLQRYEDVGGAFAMAGILALWASRERPAPWRSLVVAIAFFMLPLIHPVFSGLGAGWVIYLTLSTLVLRLPWRRLVVAGCSYAAGWATFLTYYWSRPWLYAQFQNHAQQNVEITRTQAPTSLHTFLNVLISVDSPTRGGTLLYLLAFATLVYLLCALVKSGREWQAFLVREELAIFTALGFVGTLGLAQLSYNWIAYWAAPWPFAAACACLGAYRLWTAFPAQRRLVTAAMVVLMLLHGFYLPARTWMWRRTGFLNLRSHLREFAATLPAQGNLFVPEVLWDTYGGGARPIYLNSLPFSAGIPTQKRYADYIASLIQPGDVMVIDKLQSHATLVNVDPPAWKVIGALKEVYAGAGGNHGYDMTVYQKQ